MSIVSILPFFTLLFFFLSVNAFVGYGIEGYNSRYNLTQTSLSSLSIPRLIRTIDSAKSWQVVGNGIINLASLAFPTQSSLVVVGNDGLIISAQPNSTNTSTSSNIWHNSVNLIPPFMKRNVLPPTTAHFRAVIFLNADPLIPDAYNPLVTDKIGITCGSQGIIYRSADSGNNWDLINSRVFRDLNAVTYSYNSISGNYIVFIAGNIGTIMKSIDKGQSFFHLRTSTNNNFYAIAALDENNIIAVGFSGLIVKSSNSGSNWTVINTGTREHFYSVAYYSANLILITGSDNTLLKSTDNAITFNHILINSLYNNVTRLTSLSLLSSSIGLIAARDRVLVSKFTSLTDWQYTAYSKLNNIAQIAVFIAPVCDVQSIENYITALTNQDFSFNFTIVNSGTAPLAVSALNASSSLIYWTDTEIALPFVVGFTPPINFQQLNFRFGSSSLSKGIHSFTIVVVHNSPAAATSIKITLLMLDGPSIAYQSFISQYWYIPTVAFLILALLFLYLARRRLRHIRRYNRRVRDPSLHLSFWRFYCCAINKEHDPDSQFWADKYDRDYLENLNDSDSGESEKESSDGEKDISQVSSDSISDQDYDENDIMRQILKNRFNVLEEESQGETGTQNNYHRRRGSASADSVEHGSIAHNNPSSTGGNPRHNNARSTAHSQSRRSRLSNRSKLKKK
jgi:photosystem II stability/assembly factor-like uncharacterized protein